MNVQTTETKPEPLDALKAEIEHMIDAGMKVAVANEQNVMRDPKSFVAAAEGMLQRARGQLIRAEALHHAKRSQEILAFKDRLLRIDSDHEKISGDLNSIISRLEGIRG